MLLTASVVLLESDYQTSPVPGLGVPGLRPGAVQMNSMSLVIATKDGVPGRAKHSRKGLPGEDVGAGQPGEDVGAGQPGMDAPAVLATLSSPATPAESLRRVLVPTPPEEDMASVRSVKSMALE